MPSPLGEGTHIDALSARFHARSGGVRRVPNLRLQRRNPLPNRAPVRHNPHPLRRVAVASAAPSTTRRTQEISMARLSALAAAVMSLSVALVAPAEEGSGDAMAKIRLQTMLLAGDEGMVVATFKRYPGQTLPFIDSYLEGGLAMIEKAEKAEAGKQAGDAHPDAQQSFRMGIRFAKLADTAFGGTDFSEYANAFASWSPSEQKSFREGQRLFKEGMRLAKDEPAKAIDTLDRSLRLAETLNDTWGQIMAQGALAELYLAAGGEEQAAKAEQSARAAVTLSRKVRLDEDRVSALRVHAKAIGALGGKAEARATPLQEAWTLLRRDASMSPELRAAVANDLIAAFEELKRPDAAAEVRKELGGTTDAKPAPGAAK